MNSKILVGTALSACAIAALAAKDPVIMTINGVDVPRSEFEYLYHKNTQQQQLDPQPIEEYAELFQLYKMKVADALAAGIDTTTAFRKEMEKYRHDLAEPYLTDSTLLNKFVAEAVELAGQEVEIKHIMMHKNPQNAKADAADRERLDSIRGLLLQGQDFTTLATEYSQDPGAKQNFGNLGFFTTGRLPYTFEKTAWALPEGAVSEIVESPMNYHIIVGGKKRPARGQVHASHIMKMARPGCSPEEEVAAKAKIDSIYAVIVANPNKFEELALAESDDKNSARQGGLLPWFGAGQMVPEFEAVSFALADGEISQPIRTTYGWHIVKKLAHKGAPTLEELKPELLQRMANPQDERFKAVKDAQTLQLALKHNGRINDQALGMLKEASLGNGLDSAFYATYTNGPLSETTIFTIGKTNYPVKQLLAFMNHYNVSDPAMAPRILDNGLEGFYNRQLINTEEDWLLANEPDYRNLFNEYRDGSLLYEISLKKVWDKASQDVEGLENYFLTHRNNYTWDEPRVKGILVQAANDSVASLIKERMSQLAPDSINTVIRKEFPRQAKLDRVLVKKGDNAMVDNIMYGAPAVEPSDSRYTVYFLFNPRQIDAPEEAADVRGRVTNDYQNQLEEEWISDMRKRYKVKVNQNELKKVK